MSLLSPPRYFDPNCPELMDRPEMDRALLREELLTLERFNQRFGGQQLVLDYLKRFVRLTKADSLRVLDLGTGPADIPRALVEWARHNSMPITITAVDRNPAILQIAESLCGDFPEIRLEQQDLRSLPYASDGFDLVLCSQALHHFTTADALAILRRMHELSRGGYIVNDLRRNWAAIWLMAWLTPLLTRSVAFQNDADQSCRAAFTVGELRGLATQAEMKNFQVNRHHWFFHMVLFGRK